MHGIRILPEHENEIIGAVKELLSRHEDMQTQIESIRKANVVNFGCAGEPIAQALIDMANSVKSDKSVK